ncbi:MAG: ribosome biogenesis GTPase Der [Bryobacteraceae bacterium]|jgi:GTP-binding protein
MPDAIPTVVIVGRPNVGKSTLFNRITGQRRAITGNEPGITRDRIHGLAEYRGRRFKLVDTGGILVHEHEHIPAQILRQAEAALRQAASIILLVDGRGEIAGPDRDLAQMLRRLGKPVALAVNKIEAPGQAPPNEFYELGIADLFPISAEHGLGVDALLDRVTAGFSEEAAAEEPPARETIKVAIIGRPNVGKSTLLNALTGQERAIVSPVAGTTRDAVDETVARDGVDYVLVDTAGIRHKGKTKLMAEKLSVVMARRHIRMAHVVLLILDATEGVIGLDATIAGYAHEGGRALVLCVNKWDQMKGRSKQKFESDMRDAFKFLDYAPVAYLSAKTGAGVEALFPLAREAYESASRRIPTSELNRFVESLRFEDRKIFYITQHSIRPPAFLVFTDRGGPLYFSHERYLMNQIRRKFGFKGTPILVESRAKKKARRR